MIAVYNSAREGEGRISHGGIRPLIQLSGGITLQVPASISVLVMLGLLATVYRLSKYDPSLATGQPLHSYLLVPTSLSKGCQLEPIAKWASFPPRYSV